MAGTRTMVGHGWRPLALALAQAALALLLLAAPAGASAATFVVNRTNDARDTDFGGTFDGACDSDGGTGGDQCTLRAAIEEANAASGADAIDFDPALTGCAPADLTPCTIVVNTTAPPGPALGPLPQLTDVVTIDGCSADPNHAGPCAGVQLDSPGTSAALDVGAGASTGTAAGEFTTIRGLAIGNADRGIEIAAGASGVRIANDWLGLKLDATASPDATGIRVGDAADVTIGGPIDAALNRNYVAEASGGIGISIGTAPRLRLLYNRIGLDPAGGIASGAGSVGVQIDGPAAPADGATITGNRFGSDPTGVPLRLDGPNTTVAGNTFGLAGTPGSGGAVAVLLTAGATANRIGEPTFGNVIGGAAAAGVLILGGDANTVRHDRIGTDSGGADRANGGPGVQLADSGADPANDNTIGAPLAADSVAEENLIANSGTDAIEITGTGTGDVIGRNHGSANGSTANDLFIDLGADGPGNPGAGAPNGGVRVPVITTATTDVASGTAGGAQPEALVRLFRISPGAANGGLDGFIGEVTADAATGAWTIDHSAAPVPAGTLLVATQTTATGTSELSATVPAADIRPPALEVTLANPQRPLHSGGVAVFASCDEACPKAIATGTLRVFGDTYSLLRETASLPANRSLKLKMLARPHLLAVLKHAFATGRRPHVRIHVTARDAAGNATLATRGVRLVP